MWEYDVFTQAWLIAFFFMQKLIPRSNVNRHWSCGAIHVRVLWYVRQCSLMSGIHVYHPPRHVAWNWEHNYIMILKTFRLTVPLWWESTICRWIPQTKSQHGQLLMIWDATRLKWCHWNSQPYKLAPTILAEWRSMICAWTLTHWGLS